MEGSHTSVLKLQGTGKVCLRLLDVGFPEAFILYKVMGLLRHAYTGHAAHFLHLSQDINHGCGIINPHINPDASPRPGCIGKFLSQKPGIPLQNRHTGGHGSNHARFHQIPGSLHGCSQECIRGAAQQPSLFMGQRSQFLGLAEGCCQHLFRVHMLAMFQKVPYHPIMGRRIGQVHHNLNPGILKDFLHGQDRDIIGRRRIFNQLPV